MDLDDNKIVDWEQIIQLFCLKGGKGKQKVTPLEAAVKAGYKRMVERLLFKPNLFFRLERDEVGEVVKSAMNLAQGNPELLKVMKVAVRRVQAKSILYFIEDDLEKMMKEVQEHEWYPPHVKDVVWTPYEEELLHDAIVRVASKGRLDILKWLMNEWKGNLVFQKDDSTMKIPDHVVAGDSNHCAPCFNLIRDLEVSPKVFENQDWFYYQVNKFWDKDSPNISGLIEAIEDYRKRMHSDNGTKPEEDCWTLMFLQPHAQGQIEVLKYFHSLYVFTERPVSQFMFYMPRLDLVVLSWSSKVFEWMSTFLDLTENFNGRNLYEARNFKEEKGIEQLPTKSCEHKMEDSDICAICLDRKINPIGLPCEHTFCKFCIRQYSVRQGIVADNVRCPLCRSAAPIPFDLRIIDLFCTNLNESAPWLERFVSPETMSIGHIVFGLASGCDAILILESLLKKPTCVNPPEIRFKKNMSARGSFSTVKWLCLNGFKELILEVNDDGVTPYQMAASGQERHCSTVLEFLWREMKIPDDWVAIAETNPHTVVILDEFKFERSLASLQELLLNGAPLEAIHASFSGEPQISELGLVSRPWWKTMGQNICRGCNIPRKSRCFVLALSFQVQSP
jgi:hypothetical protein